jgi:ankyrin repeat protein
MQLCKALLQIGANMNLYNKAGITSFSSACLHGDAHTAAYMLQLGADVNGGSQQPLFLACKGSVGKQLYRHDDSTPEQQAAWRAAWASDKETRAIYM